MEKGRIKLGQQNHQPDRRLPHHKRIFVVFRPLRLPLQTEDDLPRLEGRHQNQEHSHERKVQNRITPDHRSRNRQMGLRITPFRLTFRPKRYPRHQSHQMAPLYRPPTPGRQLDQKEVRRPSPQITQHERRPQRFHQGSRKHHQKRRYLSL